MSLGPYDALRALYDSKAVGQDRRKQESIMKLYIRKLLSEDV